MKAFIKKSKKIGSKESQSIKNAQLNSNGEKNQLNKNNEEGVTNPLVQSNNSDGKLNNGDLVNSDKPPETDMINKKLPKELIIRIFSYLDIVDLCRCAQVSKFWNELALDGSNWQYVDFFDFQIDVSVLVVENLAKRCNEFLKGIRLENCRSLTDEAIIKLSTYCKNIEILNLIQCIKLTNEAFNNIGENLKKLVYLNLESCSISDIGLKSISGGCANLQSIDISYCKSLSTDALINFVGSNSNLKHFSCRSLTNINDNVIKKLAQTCPNLIYLNIKGCNNVSDEGLASLASNSQLLKHLNISNCNHLTDLTLQSLGAKCSDLKIFECAGCFNFSDNGFLALTKGCHNLSRLDFEECSRITDATLQNLSINCPNLKHLTLSRCENITDEGIRQLGISNCASVNETLQVLELDNCPLITDSSLEHLYGCQSLGQIELYDCQQITRNGIKKFQARLPNVKIHAYFAPSTVTANQRPSRSCSCRCCIIL